MGPTGSNVTPEMWRTSQMPRVFLNFLVVHTFTPTPVSSSVLLIDNNRVSYYPINFSYSPTSSAVLATRQAMSLIFTIFALVFFTQLISWIGKSVLLELVRPVHPIIQHHSTDIWPLTGLCPLPTCIQVVYRCTAAETQVGSPCDQKTAPCDKRAGPVCQVG